MTRYERLLVCIDGPEPRAAGLLSYVAAFARFAKSREISVLHVAENGMHGTEGDMAAPPAAAELTPETLNHLASEHLEDMSGRLCRCEVLKGAPLLEVLRYAHDRDIDLIVIGRSSGCFSEDEEKAVLARRITRKSTCSVLVLPEDSKIKVDTILVPVRDSDCSANALDTACDIAAATGADVIALNVYQVHTGYSRVGTSLDEHQALLASAAQRESEKLIERVDTRGVNVRHHCAADHHDKPVPVILEAVKTDSADLLVIGARGRSGAAGVLLGKVTEQLITRTQLPLLAVKKKGECIGILRALLTLAGEG